MNGEEDAFYFLAFRPVFRLDSAFSLFYTLPMKSNFLSIEAPCTKVQSRLGGIPCKENVFYCSSLTNPSSKLEGIRSLSMSRPGPYPPDFFCVNRAKWKRRYTE